MYTAIPLCALYMHPDDTPVQGDGVPYSTLTCRLSSTPILVYGCRVSGHSESLTRFLGAYVRLEAQYGSDVVLQWLRRCPPIIRKEEQVGKGVGDARQLHLLHWVHARHVCHSVWWLAGGSCAAGRVIVLWCCALQCP